MLSARRSKIPLILSGGLSPDNVAEAIAATQPWAVDTASGTELAPGIKDAEKVRAFLEIATGVAAA
jgi:phosphoribosylanthranilate isomerase